MALAGAAGDGASAGFGAGATAGAAFVHGRHAQLRFGAARRLFQRDLEVVAQIRAAVDVATPAARLAEDVAKNVAERVREIARTTARPGAAHIRVDAGMAELIVGGALLAVGEHLVGLLGLLEALLGLGVVRIAVRMKLHGQLAIGLLDVVVRCVAVDPQHIVKIALCHDW